MNSAINNKADNSDLTALQGVVDGKMDEMTVDSAPTSGSSNLVTSGGVYTAINNKSVSNVGVTVDDDNNLTVTVEQADGTSKSGSVILPAGGEIEVEERVSMINDIINRTVVYPQDFAYNITGKWGSHGWTIMRAGSTTAKALCYDAESKTLKECTFTNCDLVSDGTMNTSSYSTALSYTMLIEFFSFLIGVYVDISDGTGSICYRDGTYVYCANCTVTDYVISAINNVNLYGSSVVQWTGGESTTLELATTTDFTDLITPDSILNMAPSSYTKIIDL